MDSEMLRDGFYDKEKSEDVAAVEWDRIFVVGFVQLVFEGFVFWCEGCIAQNFDNQLLPSFVCRSTPKNSAKDKDKIFLQFKFAFNLFYF